MERLLDRKQKHIHDMSRIFKHKILAGAMLLGFMFAGSSCEDKEGIKVTAETPLADKTLYEVIINDPELSDFVKVLDACGAHCADSLFNQSRVYTVWAPVNGSFNADEVIGGMGEDKANRDMVLRSFVETHVANHLVPANGTLGSDNTVMLLNNKLAEFTGDYKNGYTFSGIPLDPNNTNIRVKNGLLHKIVSPSEYKYSIWEYLKFAKNSEWNIDSIAEYLYSFDVTEFNPGQSISGPIVDGEQTYLDSVFTTSNIWLDTWNGVGLLNSEDSTYTVYVPTNEVWDEMVAKAESHFNYDLRFTNLSDAKKIERDSLRRYYARLNNLKYMTYSVNEQRYLKCTDSMMPAYRNGKRHLFPTDSLEKNVIFEKELSNGIFKVVNVSPYKQTDLWHDTIFLEGENQSMWNFPNGDVPQEVERLYANKNQINKDSMLLGAELSGGAYFSYTTTSAKTAYFKIPKVLSAKYHVAIIFVPRNITDEFVKDELMSPNKLTFKIFQDQGVGSAIQLCNITPTNAIYTDPYKLDTVFLTNKGEKVVINPRYCEFYDGTAKEYNVRLEVKSNAGTDSKTKKKYDTAFRIDKIMLIPVLDTEE